MNLVWQDYKKVFLLAMLLGLLFLPVVVNAEDISCLTTDDCVSAGLECVNNTCQPVASSQKPELECSDYSDEKFCKEKSGTCFWFPPENCLSRTDTGVCKQLTKTFCGTKTGSSVCKWQGEGCAAPAKADGDKVEPTDSGEGVVIDLPPCAEDGSCRNLNNLVQLIVNFGHAMFKIVGMFAFVFFVYGGFTMIFSFGNPEKVKKGRDILIAALTGLIVVFGAYFLINFMLDAIGVKAPFNPFK